ncbi:MAG: hypothetical protein KGI72_05640 [Patescibacteria group bacterium]|nr:hypothetical protein [Patescibacteria group bacterium]
MSNFKNQNSVFSWVAPTTSADGSPLTDLAGYQIQVGTAAGVYNKTVPLPIETSCKVSALGLADGTYFCVVEAIDAAGNVSTPSNEITFTLDSSAPAAPTGFTIS